MKARVMIVTAGFAVAGMATAWAAFQATQHPQNNAGPVGDVWARVAGPRRPWIAIGHMDPSVVSESSGFIKSRKYPGIYWTHGDSFNPAAIFAVKECGEVAARVNLSVPNVDWEDISTDDEGNLYIGDIGNNLHLPITRQIHKIREPDPATDDGETITPTATYSYTYPKESFDAEGLFVRNGVMFIVSRHDENRAKIYRLAPDAHNVATLNEIAVLRIERASGAAVSPDGTRLAVCTTRDTWIYRVDENMVPLENERPVFVRYPNDNVEGCCFDGDDLMLSNEKGEIFRVTSAEIADGVVFVPLATMFPAAPASTTTSPPER